MRTSNCSGCLMPLKLSDAGLAAVTAVVGRLPWRLRGAFLQELAATFGGSNRAGGPSLRFLVSRLNRPVPTNCLRSPYRGTNRTLRFDIGSPARIFAEAGDRRQCRDLLAVLDEECLVTEALADCRRFGGRVLVRTRQ